MEREVRPELLDELPADDPQAIQSRLDLRRVNAWMGHARRIADILGRYRRGCPAHVVDLGGGDGTLMLEVARHLGSTQRPVQLCLVDRQNLLSPERIAQFEQLGWNATARECDVFDWAAVPEQEKAEVVIANLFLHHFEAPRLQQLLASVAERTHLFIACEPRRFRASVFSRGLLWLIGCNSITRHDGEISVRAGFRDLELSALWPANGAWSISEWEAGAFSHCFVAQRV